MKQLDYAFWIFIILTLVFLAFQALENWIAQREYKSPELPFLMLSIFCSMLAIGFHMYEVSM